MELFLVRAESDATAACAKYKLQHQGHKNHQAMERFPQVSQFIPCHLISSLTCMSIGSSQDQRIIAPSHRSKLLVNPSGLSLYNLSLAVALSQSCYFKSLKIVVFCSLGCQEDFPTVPDKPYGASTEGKPNCTSMGCSGPQEETCP